MLSATADVAGTVHLMGSAPTGIYCDLNGHEIAAYRNLASLWAGWFLDVRQLSDNKPESLIRSPSTIAAQWFSAPNTSYADELLDWEVFVKAAPVRPMGALFVTLEYGGRGTPTPLRDPWD